MNVWLVGFAMTFNILQALMIIMYTLIDDVDETLWIKVQGIFTVFAILFWLLAYAAA